MTDQATERQILAADPGRSTWVSANAGSGKTRVLTNRVARLLLAGCAPQKILCLTYTKAAAAEMQNRLFDTLGSWAMKPDGALSQELAKLGETAVSSERLSEARKLFARALETPGGLKIQTIHSFCGAVLRRFPLEAGVSPQFQEMDDRQAKQLRAEILETLAEQQEVIFADMADFLSGEDTDELLNGILKHAHQFDDWDDAKIAEFLDAEPNLSDRDILARAMQGVSDDEIQQLADAMAEGGKNDKIFAARVAAGRKLSATDALEIYQAACLTKGQMRSDHNFPTKAVKTANPWVPNLMDKMKQRMYDARQAQLSRDMFLRTRALHNFAREFLRIYQDHKLRLGRLDFEDLIQKTKSLLTAPGYAGWVLYRLDGGIDHILVDEAQDTAPDQWDIVKLLADEFFDGDGAQDMHRTIFVVGDEKQSIYSFQGADPREFGKMQTKFDTKLAGISESLQQVELLHSFRSAPPILALVDRVFAGDVSGGVAGEVRHRAFKADMPGRVELWPFIEKQDDPDPVNWWEPVDSVPYTAPHVLLAESIAERVSGILTAHQQLPGTDRAIRAGDFMILVQSRGKLFHAIIKALKTYNVAVAGADRLKIAEELAVKDLLALLQFLSTPEDDLSLAAVLRSPLGGISEQDLYRLACNRRASLWLALREKQAEYPEVYAMLDKLLRQSDFIRPYDILAEILITHEGRRKLIARLGAEAEDGIDELLNQALNYENIEAPTLTGFIGWITSDDVEVKRQMDAEGDHVRVMTVHGAKGLEAPIVILPDTTKRDAGRHAPQVISKDGNAIWKATSDHSPHAMIALEEDRRSLVREESERLLYVAMTRAERWLIVAGAGDATQRKNSWYDAVEQAFPENAQTETTPDGIALILQHNWTESVGEAANITETQVSFPLQLLKKVPPPPRKMQYLAPSELGGTHTVGQGGADDGVAALKRGTDIHKLLEVLPSHPIESWSEIADGLVDNAPEILPEVKSVLSDPKLQFIFAKTSLSEVPVTAHLTSLEAPILGRIDRLIVEDESVLAIDFKSNRVVPDSAEQVPTAFLKQMGAYAEALASIYPNKKIRAAILWTASGVLMDLPENVIAASLRLDAS